jgi:hypothetical protein
MKRIAAITILGIALVVGVGSALYKHWWFQVGSTIARRADGAERNVQIYKSFKGDMLFLVKDDSLGEEYMFFPDSNMLGVPNGTSIRLIGPLGFSADEQVGVVSSADRIKMPIDMEVDVTFDYVEFQTWGRYRIKTSR